jgi:hypothetical protein
MAFIGNLATCKTNTDTAKRTPCLGACGPVRVPVSMCHERASNIGLSYSRMSLRLLIDYWGRSNREFRSWSGAPEIETIVAGVIQKFQSMFEAVLM